MIVMPEYTDRLSALMSHFALEVAPSRPDDANLVVLAGPDGQTPGALWFSAVSLPKVPRDAGVLFSARVDWGGPENPLLMALPTQVIQDLENDPDCRVLADLLCAEQSGARCGVASVLSRLCEVLIVRLMRRQIEAGGVAPGLLGGLSDPRLSRAIVAMHDAPGDAWTTESLAHAAGLSVSRFGELFRAKVGDTPLAYLRRWRLVLAKQDIARGTRIQSVAAKYGYGSTEALSRAISGHYGMAPMQIRKAALGAT